MLSCAINFLLFITLGGCGGNLPSFSRKNDRAFFMPWQARACAYYLQTKLIDKSIPPSKMLDTSLVPTISPESQNCIGWWKGVY